MELPIVIGGAPGSVSAWAWNSLRAEAVLGVPLDGVKFRFELSRRLRQGAKGFGRNGDMAHAARFQILQMLDRRVEQLVIG